MYAASFYWFTLLTSFQPKILPNQVQREILTTILSMPFMTILTVPIFIAELRGYSKLTDTWGSWSQEALTILKFLVFTDFCIYWIHRWLHHPWVYPTLHKTHHLWKVCTPWASHAFHPVDGFLQVWLLSTSERDSFLLSCLLTIEYRVYHTIFLSSSSP
mmetsp:Transcript_30206/g.79918  ORF Transcript_30206/g.79918 Transcript_30206/m.79918 type:complete len:159 (-) Transcript_30206:702-1178(-)